MMENNTLYPRWINELRRFQSLKSQIFLYGNVYDCYYFPVHQADAGADAAPVFAKFGNSRDLLQQYFYACDYDVFSYFDVIDGLTIESKDGSIDASNVVKALNLRHAEADAYLRNAVARKPDDAISFYRQLMTNTTRLSVAVVNFTSRFTSNPNALEEEARGIFLKMLKSAQESRVFPEKDNKRNILIFICDKLNDIPAWLLLENPLTKGIEIQKPSREERERFFEQRQNQFFSDGAAVNIKEAARIFPDLTENFTNTELENLIIISKQEKIHINNVKEIIDLYKYGVRENPWEKIDDERIKGAADELGAKVLGQQNAIKKAVEIIRRSKLGLDNIDKTKPGNKPKGVLFFAGPTGTGKTELCKSLSELIFSNEEAMIRFDMSEYNDSNSDVKLIGSPPGYVGYEEGGQLTDAIRKKPFSIVLFDEIEKAHPRIFDKFLQILDDGRLTDGKGETAYFTQSLIVFTSNLGMYKDDDNGRKSLNVAFGESYDVLEKKIKEEIKAFFNNKLGRPEILNRFGDNFVVFDFIRPDVAVKIVEKNLNIIKNNLYKYRQITLEYDGVFCSDFMRECAADNLDMGGRGIVNRIETHIKNGLTNFIFESGKVENCTIKIKAKNKCVVFE